MEPGVSVTDGCQPGSSLGWGRSNAFKHDPCHLAASHKAPLPLPLPLPSPGSKASSPGG
ncbi:MAG: hypothetical protein NXI25_25485 [bacterium]|nr:hypothetical protein [bacterium]